MQSGVASHGPVSGDCHVEGGRRAIMELISVRPMPWAQGPFWLLWRAWSQPVHPSGQAQQLKVICNYSTVIASDGLPCGAALKQCLCVMDWTHLDLVKVVQMFPRWIGTK